MQDGDIQSGENSNGDSKDDSSATSQTATTENIKGSGKHSFTPSMEDHGSWESPANVEVHNISVILAGKESYKAEPWLQEHPRFSVVIHVSNSYQETLTILRANYIDICIVDSSDADHNTNGILEHIKNLKMPCSSIVLSDGVDIGRDDFLYSLGATDVCHYINFDQTTLTHIIHNVYLRAQTSFQYQQEINRMSSHLLNMAHELKNPLNAILGFSQRLQKSATYSTVSKDEKNLKRIINNSNRIRQLIDELLDLGRMSSDKIELKIADVNINQVVKDVFEQQKIYADAHNLDLSYAVFGMDVQCNKIQADPLRMYQIISNLVSNALKYTDSGGVNVSLRWVEGDTRQLQIEVKDTGIGLDEEDLPAIFDQYQKVEHKIQKEVDSTGLGLPITLELVKQHNGHISVESERGKGSTFSVLIPEKFVA